MHKWNRAQDPYYLILIDTEGGMSVKSLEEAKMDVIPQEMIPSKSAQPILPVSRAIEGPSVAAPYLSNYLDYRRFLSDFYAYKRFQTRGDIRPYSYAVFAAAADIKSPNYLKMIIEGRRNLSEEMISKFARALGLNKEQSDEFRTLVLFSQAIEPAQRNLFLKVLSEIRVEQKLRSGEIDRKIWEKAPNWIGWILYAMTEQQGVTFDVNQVRALLRNKASAEEISLAMESLTSNGWVEVREDVGSIRSYVKSSAAIEANEEVPAALVRKLQSELMYLGLESLHSDSPQEREFGSLTLAMTKAEFEDLRFKLRQLRKQAMTDNAAQRSRQKGERVYQLNLQLFPVTEKV